MDTIPVTDENGAVNPEFTKALVARGEETGVNDLFRFWIAEQRKNSKEN